MVASAHGLWTLTPLPDKGPWENRNRIEYKGRTFVVGCYVPRQAAEGTTFVRPAARDWCGWSLDENLINIIGTFSFESVTRMYVDMIDAQEEMPLT